MALRWVERAIHAQAIARALDQTRREAAMHALAVGRQFDAHPLMLAAIVEQADVDGFGVRGVHGDFAALQPDHMAGVGGRGFVHATVLLAILA